MLGFDMATAAGLLMLAGNVMQCTVPKAPEIIVSPTTAPIEYNFNLSSAELDGFKSDTINPYAPGVDTTTRGLRHDRPEIRTEVQLGIQHDPYRQMVCLWYDKIDIKINLSPKIYVAREEGDSKTCREAIMGHELKHVDTDREVINRYAQGLGLAVKGAVDGAGALGPYKSEDLEEVKKRLVDHVQAAMDSRKLQLYQEMAQRQGDVDTLEEYERVRKICKEAKK